MDWQMSLSNVLTSAAVGTALTGVLAFIFRAWLSARLNAGIKHEYDDKLEKVKADLKIEGDRALATFKFEIDRQNEKLRIAASSFSDVQKATIAKRIEAIEALWSGVLEAKLAMPSVITLTDVLTRKELLTVHSMDAGRDIRAIDRGLILKFFGTVELHRPFLGEVIWAQFAAFQAVRARVLYLFLEGESQPNKLIWYEDKMIQQMIGSALGPESLDEFSRLQHGRFKFLNTRFEQQLAQRFESILSGREFGSAALINASETIAITERALSPES